MEIPNLCRGFNYPTSRYAKCPRFHACFISKKCQNFDKHNFECAQCESRVRPITQAGGYLPEGEYMPDLQDAMSLLEKTLKRAMVDPDADGQVMNSVDVTRDWERVTRASETLKAFMTDKAQLEETVMHALVDPELASKLGRLE